MNSSRRPVDDQPLPSKKAKTEEVSIKDHCDKEHAAEEKQQSHQKPPVVPPAPFLVHKANATVNGHSVPLGPIGRDSDPGQALRAVYLREILDKMVSEELRTLTLHGIWALLLALGWKNVENRSRKTSTVPKNKEWVMLQASATKATRAELESFRADARRHLTRGGSTVEADRLYNAIAALHPCNKFPRSQWVGFVRFSRIATYEQASNSQSWGTHGTSGWWHRSANEQAWIIDAAIPMLPEKAEDYPSPKGALALAKIASRLKSNDWASTRNRYDDMVTLVESELKKATRDESAAAAPSFKKSGVSMQLARPSMQKT